MKTTRYFEEQVVRKRPYIERSCCAEVIANPLRRLVQDDGPPALGVGAGCSGRNEPRVEGVLRVVTLDDGETIHNAFFDRDFRENEP
jgi:hypothetical protein